MTTLSFPPFTLDLTDATLMRGHKKLAVLPKDFAVLHYLASHAGHLVTKDALLQTVWNETHVSAGVLKTSIERLRRTLGDRATTPRFIETVQRRGYRFIGKVVSSQHSVVSSCSPPSQSSALSPQHSVFVGRDREMAELLACLGDTCNGQGRLVLLVGEPGIGKTRTANELALQARARAIPVLHGRCEEGDGTPPLWPWTQVVRNYLSQTATPQLRKDLGAGTADMARAFPEIQEHLPDLQLAPETVSAQARFRFFDSFSLFLKRVTQQQPLVIILDDLHWADAFTLLLLQFVAKELPDMRLLMLITYRDVEGGQNEQLSPTLGALARVQESRSLALSRFSQDEVSRFIALVTAQTPPLALVSAVYQRTEGNPFFVTEVVHAFATRSQNGSTPSVSAATATLPHRVRDAVALRLQAVSHQCREMLTFASALGLEFRRTTLEALCVEGHLTFTPEQLAQLLREAEAAHFIVTDVEHLGRYRFAHALVQETLYGAMDSPQRTHLHHCIGKVLEQTVHADTQLHLAELARHFSQGVPTGDINKALTYTSKAAEQAAARFGYEEAAEYYRRALQLLDLQPNERQRGEWLIALGEAQRRVGATEAARTTFRQASELARALAAPELLARAALGFAVGFAGINVSGGVEDPLVVSLLEEALRGLATHDSPLRARVLGRLAMELYWSESQEHRNALSQQAVQMARRLNDPVTLAYTLNARQVALWGPDNLAERLAGAHEMIRLAKQVGDQELALRGQIWLMTALLEQGDLKQADREFVSYVKRAQELRQPAYLWFIATWRGMRCWLRGEFAEADRWAREAFLIGERAQDPDAVQCYVVQISSFRGAVKSMQDLELPTRGYAEQMATVPAWRAGLALLYAGLQQEALARQEFEPLAAHGFTDLPRNADWMVTMTNLLQVSALLRDLPRATQIYNLLLPFADHCLVIGASLVCHGSIAWYLALLATTLERWDEAESLFKAALQQNIRLGTPPMILQTKHRYAEMLLRRQRPGDQQKALVLLDEAIAMAQAINMEITLQAMLSLREQTPQTQKAVSSAAAKLALVQRGPGRA
jgi:DNA-binding winged helix-turn-helix (wHTH) protein/tetratricopeptide (TPR) repeat protein